MSSLPPSPFLGVTQLVNERTGLVFDATRQRDVEAAARRAMALAGIDDPAEYLQLLRTEILPLDELVAELTVGETYFFRDLAQFEFIRREVLPEARRRRSAGEPLRLWSAGCSSGEEPYSLAMLLADDPSLEPAHVLGTDISPRALGKAREATYGAWSLRGEGAPLAMRHLRAEGKRYLLDECIRQRVTFSYLNLAGDAYPSAANSTWGMDLILCRNVLIYFDPATIERVGRRLFDSLAPGGWLVLASSDPPLARAAPFEVVTTPSGLFYRRPAPALAAPPPSPAPPLVARRDTPRRAPLLRRPHAQRSAPTPREDLAAEARALANRGDLSGAERLLSRGLLRNSLSPELHLLRAVVLLELDRLEEAAQAARRSLYLDRSLAIAHYTLGGILRRLGDDAGARAAYRNARDLADALPRDTPVPLGDGELAGRLAAAARAQLALAEQA